MSNGEATTKSTTAKERIVALEAALASERTALASERAALAEMTRQRDVLRASHDRLRLELALLQRRIFVAKAERVDTAQLELEFATTLAALDRLGGPLPTPATETSDPPNGKPKKKPTGRRDLRQLPLEEVRVEIIDELFEQLVVDGKATRIGFEESCKVAWKRGGMRRLVVARVKYCAVDARGETVVETAPMPPECFPRSLAAPSMLAHILTDKFCDGLPLHRIADRLGRDGVAIDRGTMSRWVEDAGATAGATVIAAARKEAWATAFCIATDATGVAIQPPRRFDDKRQACRRGHFFVLIADRDHIFFEYTPKEASLVLEDMFRGFSGYVQADAKSVYDIIFRPPKKPPDDDAIVDVRYEVGCWAHCRRKFWEAASAKSEVGREGLARIGHIFMLEDAWHADPPDVVQRRRRQHLRPHMDAFFAWAEIEYQRVRDERGMVRSALGYAIRQKDALMRVLDDGRLILENNRSVSCQSPTPNLCGSTCVNLSTDPQHCSTCSMTCSYPHAGALCSGGACQMGTCSSGYGDCVNGPIDGCETYVLGSDAANCGGCNMVCKVGQKCNSGSCGEIQVTCSSAGVTCTQAGCYQAGRYSISSGGGIVVDLNTARRLWTRAPFATNGHSVAAMTCSTLALEGINAWRLPAYTEIQPLQFMTGGLNGCPTCFPAIDQAAFKNIDYTTQYWTSDYNSSKAGWDTPNFCDGRNNYFDATGPLPFLCTHDPLP